MSGDGASGAEVDSAHLHLLSALRTVMGELAQEREANLQLQIDETPVPGRCYDWLVLLFVFQRPAIEVGGAGLAFPTHSTFGGHVRDDVQ